MKAPTARSTVGLSSYASQAAQYRFQVTNTSGGAVAGDYRLMFIYNWNGGVSGVPGQEGETSPIPDWDFVWGAYGGIATGFHVYGQWWDAANPITSFYSVYQSPAGTANAFMGLQVITLSGVDRVKPYEIQTGDPNGNVASVGYSELDGTNPSVTTIGLTAPTAAELMIGACATGHDTGANNISHELVGTGVTVLHRVNPTFPGTSDAMGNGIVQTLFTKLITTPGATGTFNRQALRYAGTEFEELAASDPSAPDIDYGSVTFRIAMRGTVSSAAAMI